MTTPSLSLPSATATRAASFPPILVGWGVLAAAATFAGVVDVERRFVVPAVVFLSTFAMVVAYRREGSFRAWARSLSWPSILAFQALRAPIGMAFLVWAAKGLAPVVFASGAGYGDLAVGVLAIGLLAFGSQLAEKRSVLLAWNVIGLLDIAAVVVSAQIRFLVLEPEALRGLLSTWFPLLPLFYVPLVIVAHLLVFARLREARAARSGS